jgi:chemotaxis protein CheC
MFLDQDQTDLLKEILNVGVGKSAALLSDILNTPIALAIPEIVIKTLSEMRDELQQDQQQLFTTIKLNFEGQFSGVAEVLFSAESASYLISILTEDDVDSSDLDSLRVGTLSEIANIVLNGVMGSIANMLGTTFDYKVPVYLEGGPDIVLAHEAESNAVVLISETRFEAKQYNIKGKIILLRELASFDALKKRLDEMVNEL